MSVIYIYRLIIVKITFRLSYLFFSIGLFLFYFPFFTCIPLRKGGQMRHKTEEIRRGFDRRGESQKILGQGGREITREREEVRREKSQKQERKMSQK